MPAKPRLKRRYSTFYVLAICVLILSALPNPAFAEITIQQSVDNSISEFVRGNFQRTSLGTIRASVAGAKTVDQPGAAQLAPIGVLKNWNDVSTIRLPKPLYRMGAAAIGDRIFVMGGITPSGASSTSVAEVWSVQVSRSDGHLLQPGFVAEPALPAVVGSIQSNYGLDVAVAAINSPAVASIDNGNGSGYLYVIGGNASVGTVDFSSFAVRIATVGTNGRISSWQEGARLPSLEAGNPLAQHGLQSAAAFSFTVNGKTFVYVLGGLQKYRTGTGAGIRTFSQGSVMALYAQVGANGKLFKPSSPSTEGWDVLADTLPLQDIPPGAGTVAGLWDAVATPDHFPIEGDAVYLTGGQITPNQDSVQASFSSRTYMGRFASDGKLTWVGDPMGTLPQSRTGMAGPVFRGNFYLTGGIPNAGNEPDRAILTSYVQDDLTLPTFGVGGSNFLKNDVLPSPRTFHSSVVITSNSTAANSAFLYVIGGRGDTTDGNPADDQGTDEVIYGLIGGSEDVNDTGYAPDGWYYSTPFAINFLEAEVREISWATLITRTASIDMDIELDYRVAPANTCSNPGWDENAWQSLDGVTSDAQHRSLNGQNTQQLTNQIASCFQYRARLVATSLSGSTLPKETPSLLNVTLKIVLPGSPDLKVQTLRDRRNTSNDFTGLDVVLINKNDVEKTQPADPENLGGSFFVDLFVFAPGQTVVTPTLPLAGADLDRSKGFANIAKSQFAPNATFTIIQWCDSASNDPCKPLDLIPLFRTTGKYTVMVAVDSFGCAAPRVCVAETSTGGEGNNIKSYSFTISSPPKYGSSLPLISR